MSDDPSSFPLSPTEEKLRKHATLCSIGFLILLPFGVLVARYTRTFTKRWFWAHALIQFLISGPIIFAGWALGYQTTASLFTGGHFVDPHKKTGLALLILYLLQLFGGMIIHYVKIPSFLRGHRPPQNYFHAIMGLAIIALAFFQVHYGITKEWVEATGGLHPVPGSAMRAWIALVVIFWVLYVSGLALLPRQYKQEAAGRSNYQEKIALGESGQTA